MKLNLKCIEAIKNLLEKQGTENKTAHHTDLSNALPSDIEATDAVLLPNVLLWDPLTRYLLTLYCPHCQQDHYVNNPLTVSSWYMSKGHPPRMIWDRGWYCALVGRQYNCSKNHKIVSYHFGVLKQIPSNKIPFILTHQTGMTKLCYDLIVKMIEHSNSFQMIQEFLEGLFVDTFERKRSFYPPGSVPDIDDNKVTVPLDSSARQYFILQYENNKDIYQAQMDRIPFNQLRVVTNENRFEVNVGYRQNFGKKKSKWNKLFDKMFLVFNEIGCIKAYGLTNGTCIEQVIECLTALAPFNPDTEIISMNGFCCVARETLTESFPKCSVKYGIQCAKDLLKQHIDCPDEKHEIFKDLDRIFRPNGDSSSITGSEDQVFTNLNTFFGKWSDDSDSHKSMLKDSFLDEMESFKLHVFNGCLSHVPCSQELKEEGEIFKYLSKIFQPQFLGVTTACSLISHMVYVYNSHRLGHTKHQPIWVHKVNHIDMEPPPMGEEVSLAAEVDVAEQEVLEESSNLGSAMINKTTVHAFEYLELSAKCQRIIGLATLFYKISISIEKLPISQYHRSLQMFCSLVSEVWDGHFYFKTCRMHSALGKAEQLFIVRMLGLQILPCPVDHPSLVYSLFMLLKHLSTMDTTPGTFQELLLSKELCVENEAKTTENVEKLHRLLSREMLGEREQKYDKYLSSNKGSSTLDADSLKLMKSEVDIAMIHAAAELFGVAFVVLPSCKEVPVLTILPSYDLQAYTPCFLQFNSTDGLFNACVEVDQVLDIKQISCSCGAGHTKKKPHKTKQCMLMRCSCFAQRRSCTSSCRCLCCGNGRPVVKDIKPSTPLPKNRRRARNYNFVSPVPFKHHFEGEEVPVILEIEDNTEVIAPESLHHLFLEALTFALYTEVQYEGVTFTDSDLPDLLYGGFLTIYNEISSSSLISESDSFFKSLQAMEMDFVTKWIADRKSKQQALQELKAMSIKPGDPAMKKAAEESSEEEDSETDCSGPEEEKDQDKEPKAKCTELRAKGTKVEIPPAKGTKAETPAKSTTIETPVKSTTIETPEKSTKIETPAKGTKFEIPAKGIKVATPAKGIKVVTPAKGIKVATRAKGTKVATPAKGTKVETTAKGATVETTSKVETDQVDEEPIKRKKIKTTCAVVVEDLATEKIVKKTSPSKNKNAEPVVGQKRPLRKSTK